MQLLKLVQNRVRVGDPLPWGVRNVEGYGHGDLHVRMHVEVPSHLNAAQRQKLQEFAALCDSTVNPVGKRFFERAKKFFGQG